MTETHDSPYSKARALLKARLASEAEACMRDHLNTHPDDVEAHILLAETLRAGGKENAAVSAYELALTYAPQHPKAHLGIAEILIKKGWLHSALLVAENASTSTPQHPQAQEMVEMLRQRLRPHHAPS